MKLQSYLYLLLLPPLPALLLVSLVAWAVLLSGASHEQAHGVAAQVSAVHHDHAHAHDDVTAPQETSGVLTDPAFVYNWTIMMLAMMLPLLSDALRRIAEHSLSHRRYTGIAVFLLGYLSLWMLGGGALSWMASQLRELPGILPSSTALVLVLMLGILWQASPWKQYALNRCHLVHRIHPFGMRYVFDCTHFGMRKGAWCFSSCWALMLVPLLAERAALPLMLAVSFVMFVEQLQEPRSVAWHNPFALFQLGDRRCGRLKRSRLASLLASQSEPMTCTDLKVVYLMRSASADHSESKSPPSDDQRK